MVMFGRAFLPFCSGIVVLFGFLFIPAMTVGAQPCIEVDEWDILDLPLHYEYSTDFGCKDDVYVCDNLGWEPVPGQTVSAYHIRCECDNPDPSPQYLVTNDTWQKIVGNKQLKYRECRNTPSGILCIEYPDPTPSEVLVFPICDGTEWNWAPGLCEPEVCRTTATYVGSVTVAAGTFEDCYQISYYWGVDLRRTATLCPCAMLVEDAMEGYPLGVLESYNRCSGIGADDEDGDGYLAAECLVSRTCGGDCDDTDPDVNPGMSEIAGNGIDDDCDRTTPTYPQPANTIAASYGRSSLIGSGVSNSLALLLIPVGTVIFLRIWRRRR
jgi:hypothetical protein